MTSQPQEPLSESSFRALLASAPLASIDLVVRDGGGRVLVGRRKNEPARGSWFVPGGRIRRGETLAAAFSRIAEAELGSGVWSLRDASLLGAYTHHYETNGLGVPDLGTHYVVIAYEVEARADEIDLPETQHDAWRWVDPGDQAQLRAQDDANEAVHPNTARYLEELGSLVSARSMTPDQYAALNARRDVANDLVWQTPVVSLTGLAFLFGVMLLADTPAWGRIIASLLAFAISAASIHLSRRHRWIEKQLAVTAESYERHHGLYLLNARPTREPGTGRWSSVRVWRGLLGAFGIAALAVLLTSVVALFT